jgi:hypothetical protein
VSEFKKPAVIEAMDAMIELCHMLGEDVNNVYLDEQEGHIFYNQPVNGHHLMAVGIKWEANVITWKLVSPADYNLHTKLVKVYQDRYIVHGSDVDGDFIIGTGCSTHAADKVALAWLGKHYNETGQHSWVGAFGTVVYVEANPKRKKMLPWKTTQQ